MTSNNSKKCVIIGGSGFLGQRLNCVINSFDLWTPVVADLRSNATCDVTRLDTVVKATRGADIVINLAAVHVDDARPIERYYDVNVGGARNVCEACRQHGIQRQLFVSSVAVYGDTSGQPAHESMPHRPFNHYGKSKSQAERVYRDWCDEDPSRNLIIVRPTVIFGEGNRGNLFNLMSSIARKKFRMVGDGNVVKSAAYVGNVAEFIVHAVENCPSGAQTFNYADKPDLTTGDLVSVISDALGMEVERIPRMPYWLAYFGGMVLDAIGAVTPFRSSVSAQRVKKFCTATPIETQRVAEIGYTAPLPLLAALRQTVQFEFANKHIR